MVYIFLNYVSIFGEGNLKYFADIGWNGNI